ncbi:MAG: hypothetical protein LUE88_05575 [Clostridiales bacterium]|nr:hypothetical protein [Clostridiales bacterium]
MKRIKAACIEKTLHFMLKEDLGHAAAVAAVKAEVEHYKAQLERTRTKYKILDEAVQDDGSIMIKIKMQYNNTPVGDYLD